MRRIWILLGIALSLQACDDQEYGMGIGRPPTGDVTRVETAELRITEVYVPNTSVEDVEQCTGGGGSGGAGPYPDPFVEIAADDEALSFDTLSLCNSRGDCLSLAGESELPAGERREIAVEELGLVKAVGELVLFDSEDGVRGHVAWGADPSLLNSPYWGYAVLAGLAVPGDFVPLPFPFPSSEQPGPLAVAWEGTHAGCAEPSPPGTDGLGGEATIDAELCAGVPSQEKRLGITNIDIDMGVGADTWVDIVSYADYVVDLYGVRVCQPPVCVTFGPEARLHPDVPLRAHINAVDPGDAFDPCDPEVYFGSATPLVEDRVLLIAPGTTSIEDPTRVLFEYN